ncbi:MAG: hypothetical protein KGL39_16845 [Patescibacteria group bacterium]|nr:hypothetical protein [Patescibacteria group bacterium]
MSVELLQAVAVTAELCGRTFSEAAARMFMQDLSLYDEKAVIKALSKCRKEVKGLLTVADVVARLDDGRPGAEEAWAMMPFDERQSVVWTDEMSQAFGVCGPLLSAGDKVAARMAFKESYTRLVAESRDLGKRVNWTPSLGHAREGREPVLRDAVEKGRLSLEHAREIMPQLPAPAILALVERAVKKIK